MLLTGLLLLCLQSRLYVLQAQVHPVSAQLMMQAQTSPYLLDYVSGESHALKVILVFNDYNEPLWPVSLRFKIEGTACRICTRSDYKPSQPLYLYPGVAKTISGDELAHYFQYAGLEIEGISRKELEQGGRLPEGFYSVSLEVLDYHSGKVLSNTAVFHFYASLFDAPEIVHPQQGLVVFSDQHDWLFSWQVRAPMQLDVSYTLEIFEVTDPSIDPVFAIPAGGTIKVWERKHIWGTQTHVSTTDYPFEEGKTYAYHVVAESTDKQMFKNEGISQPRYFHYGYPQDGHIELLRPIDQHAFSVREIPQFSWKVPDNIQPNQPLRYEFALVKNAEEGAKKITSDMPVFIKTNLLPGRSPNTMYYNPDTVLTRETDYLWQVKAFSHDKLVAESDVFSFQGPPFIESFYAGRHRVWVKHIESADSNDFSGVGEVQVDASGTMKTVYFKHIRIATYFSAMIMKHGEVYAASGIEKIALTPDDKRNRESFFHSDSLILTTDYMYLSGHMKYCLPWAVASEQSGQVLSEKKRLIFEDYQLLGALRLPADTSFSLLDLPDYSLQLKQETVFYIRENNHFRAVFEGFLHLPDYVQEKSENALKLPFTSAQLRFIEEQENNLHVQIHPFDPINLFVRPLNYVIDLCDSVSPTSLKKTWKGVFLQEYEVIGDMYFDRHGQILLDHTFRYYVKHGNTHHLYTDENGLHFLLQIDSSYNFNYYFNMFPSFLQDFSLHIESSKFIKGHFEGSMRIPFISETAWYGFTVPLTIKGFMPGYLNESLAGNSFSHNSDSEEEKIDFTIQRAFFQDQERLELTVDMHWPAIDVAVHAQNHLYLYGNYDVGFGCVNGHAMLYAQKQTQISGFEINLDKVGAGRQGSHYAVGLSGNMNMGEDVSGNGDEPPIVNLYSVTENTLLDPEVLSAGLMLDNIDATSYGDELGSSDIGEGIADQWQDKDFRSLVTEQSIHQLADSLKKEHAMGHPLHAETEEEVVAEHETGLSDEQIHELEQRLDIFLLHLQDPLHKKLKELNRPVLERLQGYASQASSTIGAGVQALVDEVEKAAVATMPEYEEQIVILCQKTAVSLQNSMERELHAWIEEDVMDTLMLYLLGSFREALAKEMTALLVATLEEGFHYEKDIGDIVEGIESSLLESVQWESFARLFEGMADALLGRISAEVLLDDMQNDLLLIAGNALAKQAVRLAGEEAQEKIEALSSSAVGNVAGQLANNVEMDFSNLGDKVREGDVSGIITFDPSLIEVKTRVADFSGYVRFYEDDPVWGDSWQAGLTAKVKIKPQFEVWAEYINGSKSKAGGGTYKYWFLELGARGLGIPLTPIPLALDGAAGKVYHHMHKDANLDYYPDPNTKFGVGLQVFMYDAPAKGNVITFDVTLEASFFEPSGFMLELYGGAQIANTIEGGEIQQSLVTASGYMGFNSLNNHFIGNFSAALEKRPIICAGGDMTVDICGPKWNVAVGTRDVPIYLRVPCVAQPVFQSWFDISNYGLDMGFIIAMSQRIESPWLGFTGAKFKPWAYFDFELGGSTILYWKPFSIAEARIWMHMGVGVGMEYELISRSGNYTFAEVILGGELGLQTVETSRVWGTMYGEVTLFSFNIGFDMAFDHKF